MGASGGRNTFHPPPPAQECRVRCGEVDSGLGRCDRNSEFLQTGNHWHRETHHPIPSEADGSVSSFGRRSELQQKLTLPTWAPPPTPFHPRANSIRRKGLSTQARPQSLRAQNSEMPQWASACGWLRAAAWGYRTWGKGYARILPFQSLFRKDPTSLFCTSFFLCCQMSSYPRCPSPHQTDRKQNAWLAI